ncbi:MAG: alpha/beta hydrolase [Betaproteobacteria bacterium]|nr:alpha/beta hydrolase [Betaproteobacteria bacterium]
MPIAEIRGASIYYDVLGQRGPWVALSPGGRRPMAGVGSLGQRIANAGYRVLIHDRRNCGASDVVIDDSQSEFETWADDLHALASQLDALPAFVGGGSSGCRLALIFALRYPEAVRGLLLWRVTGGRFAAQRLAKNYYGQFIDAARAGGMAAVCKTEHFSERIAARPQNRERLMAMDASRFIQVMERWSAGLMRDADLPVIGASAEQLRSITAPACVIPGNDKTHLRTAGEAVARIIPAAELHILYSDHIDVDMWPPEEWAAKEPEQAAIFIEFMKRVHVPTPA